MKKHIHFIGIGGTAMASIAVAFRNAGFKITGSEAKEIFPPMSDYLKKNKVKYYYPFNLKKVGKPDEIVIGNAHYSDENVEVKYARENKIELEHFPRLLEKYFIYPANYKFGGVKKNSIVIAGTYGKTTITAMTAWLFESANKNPSYMLGGIPLNFNHGARLTKSIWSIAEGDEYPAASPWDYSSKFDFYHPKYLILTSAEWDHFDIFKTKKSYLDTFINLVKSMPKNGLIIAKKNGENLDKVLKYAMCKVIYYSKPTDPLPQAPQDDILNYNNLIGDLNIENWCAAITLAKELKIKLEKIKKAVKTFKGVKRRLEIRSKKNNITIIDDFAHSPSKAKESVKALVKHFPKASIFVIFEPNRGGRALKCMKNYNNIFTGIYKVFIPKLTEYKQKPGVYDVSGRELAQHLRLTHDFSRGNLSIVYQPDNKKILNNILKSAKPGDVVAFMGSRNFDGMIKELIQKL
ncbi:Mur ligase domain-containing protein [Candidatus Parcubacteria bacterium]|nr:Mur ligase domain-containing protein [Candidatus Parcubacteria bacterium]